MLTMDTYNPQTMSEPESTLLPFDTTSPSSPSRQRRRPGVLFYTIITVSLTANVLLVVAVTVQTIMASRDTHKVSVEGFSNSLSHVDTAAQVCFACNHLGPLIESKDTLYDVIRLSSGHTFCCQRQNNDITKLFGKIVSDEYLRRLTGREPPKSDRDRRHGLNINKGSTGAHLYMVPQADSPPSWTSSDIYNTSYCFNVVCGDGGIVVPAAGIYLVYSHLTFTTQPASEDTVIHVIQRRNRNLPGVGEKPVLFSKTSLTWTASAQQTSFLSAVVKLRREDIIRVTMSENYNDLVEMRKLSNYFGVIKM
ncbi:uncharacterized protein LOC125371677 isoform X1 [Haliotis rufescens]|uniref:uncharacterized protein LOC125371677 isoform X1 n=1 Tax=Haliotis rufescens TaxID=6454 RepID=UPI00201EA198|nr:uncharacterized protein LOC125371677 isoform X1 [Haliotis rufescens]